MCGADATSLRVHHAGIAPSLLPAACVCGPHVARRWPIQYATFTGLGFEGEHNPVKCSRRPTQNTSGNSSCCSEWSTQVSESDPRRSTLASWGHRLH